MRTGLGTLRRAAHWLRSQFGSRVLVLLYHRVAELATDPQMLAVTPRRFAEHLEILPKHGKLMHLQQLTKALRVGKLPRRGVVVTFDDGYSDNLWNAKPLLQRHDVPATVFVTTGNLGKEREYWWDELDRILLQPRTLPETFELRVNGTVRRWDLPEAAPVTRERMYFSLCELVRPLPEDEQQRILEEVRNWAGVETGGRPSHRALSPAEVGQLADGGLVEVGAHTVSHPVLSASPPAKQRWELQQSKAGLEEILGRPVTSFAYPFGTREDYTGETVALVRETGFTCACSNFVAAVTRRADLFQMPRVVVRDWGGDVLDRHVREWFCA